MELIKYQSFDIKIYGKFNKFEIDYQDMLPLYNAIKHEIPCKFSSNVIIDVILSKLQMKKCNIINCTFGTRCKQVHLSYEQIKELNNKCINQFNEFCNKNYNTTYNKYNSDSDTIALITQTNNNKGPLAHRKFPNSWTTPKCYMNYHFNYDSKMH